MTLLRVPRGWVVKGIEGSMELSLVHPTTVVKISDGACDTLEIDPKNYGLPLVSDTEFMQRSLEESARETLQALEGKASSWRDIFLWNGAFLIFASGKVGSLQEGLTAAQTALSSQSALKALECSRIHVIP